MSADTGYFAARPDPVNILLVDDQPAKLLTYEAILGSLGENLIRANSGTEALEQLLRHEVAVILVDVCMPGLDGFELASMIRQHPRYQKTSIILVSGVLVEDADRLKGYGSGAVDYVSVPIVPDILRAKVAVFAELFRKTQQLHRLNRELESRVAERTAEIDALLRRAEGARREAEDANRMKDEFLATLSHELRTPLNVIEGWAHLLRAGQLDSAGREKAIDTIQRNVELQTRLISDILDVSRILNGKLRLVPQPVDPRNVVRAAADALRPAFEGRHIDVRLELDEPGSPLSADPERLQQVVGNVLSNAAKFSPSHGQVLVRLAADPAQVEITICDEGPGIREDFLPFIFDRFRQADASSTRAHRGLGLGLAIAHHLVTMHGGTIEAANRRDRSGAEFRIVLPRSAAPPADHPGRPDRGPEAARDRAPGASLSGLDVLVVEDEPDGREVVTAALAAYGAEVRAAASAEEAFALILSRPPDVLISDLGMPRQDGYQLIERVRALPRRRGGDTPAIALTAYASAQDRIAVLRAGFDRHVSKPMDPAAMARIVAELARPRRPN